MRKLFIALTIAVAFIVASCGTTGPYIAGGGLFTSVKGPITAGPGKVKAKKTGTSCASNILGIIATGDNSIAAAKKAGSIKSVATVDYDAFSIMMFYSKVCTVVTGS